VRRTDRKTPRGIAPAETVRRLRRCVATPPPLPAGSEGRAKDNIYIYILSG